MEFVWKVSNGQTKGGMMMSFQLMVSIKTPWIGLWFSTNLCWYSTGIYAICLDNRLSKFSSKIIHVYVNSYFDTDWEKYVEEYQNSVSSLANFSVSNTPQMFYFQQA